MKSCLNELNLKVSPLQCYKNLLLELFLKNCSSWQEIWTHGRVVILHHHKFPLETFNLKWKPKWTKQQENNNSNSNNNNNKKWLKTNKNEVKWRWEDVDSVASGVHEFFKYFCQWTYDDRSSSFHNSKQRYFHWENQWNQSLPAD